MIGAGVRGTPTPNPSPQGGRERNWIADHIPTTLSRSVALWR